MNVTVKQLIEQNNKSRKLLTPENDKYFGDMVVYIRLNRFKDERATEEKLLNLLNELLVAQKEGKSAEELWGNSPKQFSDQIIHSLPTMSAKSIIEFSLEIIFTLFGWILIVDGIYPMIKQEDQTIALGTLALSAILLIGSFLLFVFIIFSAIKNQSFVDDMKKKINQILVILVGGFFAVGILVNFFIKSFGPTLTISYFTQFGLGCFLLLASYLLKKFRESK